jgi:outer membrane protein insertion porin family
LFGRNVSYSFGLGLQETSNLFGNKFDTREAFINNSLTFRVSEFGSLQVRQGLVMDRLKGIDPLVSSARLHADELQGSAITGSLGYTYTYDTRKFGLDPRSGVFFSIAQDFSVGNKSRRSIKTELAAGYETSVLNEDVKLTANARVGMLHMISGSSRNRERYQLGSIMRGFQAGGSGPRDFGIANQSVLGGNRFFAVQMEAQFPLGLPDEYNLKGGVFADIGSVWGVDNISGLGPPAVNMIAAGVDYNKMHVRATIGVSLFWESPLGPLRFDFSRPLRKLAEDKTQNFDFSIVSKF